MKKIFLLIGLFISICAIGFTQELTASAQVTTTQETTAPATSAKPRIDIGAGYWWTSGELNLKLYADKDWYYGLLAKKGDKVSELDNDLDAGLFIINIDAYLFWRLYADAFVGFGDFEGEHKDYDWYPRLDPDPFQLSKSDADGDVTTWGINGYFRIIEEKQDKGYLDVSLGYLYYQDDIEHLKDSTVLIYDYNPVNIPVAGHDSFDRYTFDGLRFGLRGRIQLHDRVAIKASGGIVPWLDVDNEKFWNLRDELGLPPGLEVKGEAEGTGIDLSIGLEVKVTRYFFIEAGYKYMNFDSNNGDLDWDWIATSGVDMVTEDNWNVEAERGGFYVMGRLKI